jgi:hypothetical protein
VQAATLSATESDFGGSLVAGFVAVATLLLAYGARSLMIICAGRRDLVRQAKTIFCRTKSQNIDLVRRRWHVSRRTKFNLAGRPFMTAFIGRAVELAELRRLLNSRQANLVIVEGRWRIGKSRLVEEFGRGARFLQFVGLAPTPETTAQTQRDAFSRLLSSHTGLPKLTSDDWGSLFQLLARETARAKEAP